MRSRRGRGSERGRGKRGSNRGGSQWACVEKVERGAPGGVVGEGVQQKGTMRVWEKQGEGADEGARGRVCGREREGSGEVRWGSQTA